MLARLVRAEMRSCDRARRCHQQPILPRGSVPPLCPDPCTTEAKGRSAGGSLSAHHDGKTSLVKCQLLGSRACCNSSSSAHDDTCAQQGARRDCPVASREIHPLAGQIPRMGHTHTQNQASCQHLSRKPISTCGHPSIVYVDSSKHGAMRVGECICAHAPDEANTKHSNRRRVVFVTAISST